MRSGQKSKLWQYPVVQPIAANITQTLTTELDRSAFNRTESFAANFLGVSVETIRGWRKRGLGPRFKKYNNKLVKYSVASLIEFVESQPTGGGRVA